MKTRLQLIALVTQYILSGGRRTLASGVRTVYGFIIGSSVNIIDDKDQANGYAGLDSSGKVNPSVLPSSSILQNTTIDISGSTNIDLSGLIGSVIINLTSTNPTETINTVSNLNAKLDFIWLCPSSTLTLDVNDAGVSSGNIRLTANVLTLVGSKNGSLQLMQRNSRMYEQVFKDQYV